jgi:CDP-diacylglycerol--serine O-phosphatidyltransferase
MFSLKFKGFGWRGNQLRYIFLACCAVLVAIFGIGGIPASIGLYIVTSTVRHFYLKSRKSAVSHNK